MLRNRRQNGSGSPRSTTSSPTGSPRIIVTRSIGGSPRSEVGEIDTRSPFQSVRAAVSLFGEAGTGSSPKAKPLTFKKSKTAEEKESQLNLALRELDSLKQQIKSTETTKGNALRELENAKITLQELTSQLETLCKSKQAAIEATEAAKARARQLQDEKSNSELDEHRYLLVANKEQSPLRTAKEEAEKKIRDENLVEKLEETNKAIESLQEQLNNVRTSDLDSFAKASSELDRTKKAFQEIVAEERFFRSLVDSFQSELDSFKGHNSQLKKKADEAEALAENLRLDLDNSKKELEAKTPKGEIQQFTSEAVHFLQEAEEMKKKAELLRQEAVTARAEVKEAEERLKVAAAETLASDQIHNSSITEDASDLISSESNRKIKLAVEKYEALSKKVEEIRNEADIKVATAMAQVETITANEKEALVKVEAGLKEKRDIEIAIKEALKAAEMAEAAKKVLEGQLKKKTSKAIRSRSWRIF
ncbi:WEB family protein At5g55860-like [Nicotiana tabacum]|uniref:WEB family protein At5g55860 n=4 Tax=Nicotiana tabacum TaxID=4097 RepID=A0A1S3ZFN1_TOBAC|nr:PREDICTED: WEB family protein At5g55860-like [Nicotiana tabacum]XP_016463249.1 PREDICTED: WEB family protein At5g55860-like [Nicotiana tabacum]XP_016463250.1 PREDICTED: WEB family protein At5g55860-like [Nicotiana tabacum]